MAGERDPGLREAQDRRTESFGTIALASSAFRLAGIPVFGLALLLIWPRLIWAALASLTVSLLLASVSLVVGFVRMWRVHEETVGAYKRSVHGLPARVKKVRQIHADKDPAAWQGLPPTHPIVSLLLGAEAVACWAFAAGLMAGVLQWDAGEVLIAAFAMLALATVAAFIWFLRSDRAVWDYSSRWRFVALGSLGRGRWIVLAASVVLTVGLAIWPSALAVRLTAPWFEDQYCGMAVAPATWGDCVSPAAFNAAVAADVGGNVAILGLAFALAFLNSLGGKRPGTEVEYGATAEWA